MSNADFDQYIKECQIIKMLTDEGLDIQEAADALKRAVINECLLSSAILVVLNESEEDDLTCCKEYDEATKQALSSLMKNMMNPFCCKKPQ